MFLIRVCLPDRPGTLGAVASALGTIGADIQSVEIVGKDSGMAVDDFMVRLPDGTMPDNAVSACTGVDGVQVLWCSRYPGGAGLEADTEALERMLNAPEDAGRILVEAAPAVFHCHWAVLLDRSAPAVLVASEMAPDLDAPAIERLGSLDVSHSNELPEGWVPDWVETQVAIVPVRGQRAVVLGRHGGPDFLGAEIARLRHLATMIPLS